MEIKPFKTIILGVLLTLILIVGSGVPLMMFFADTHSSDIEKSLLGNSTYLSLSLITSFLCAVLSAYLATKYSPSAEVKFGIIIGAVVILISLPLWLAGNTFQTYPIWYSAISFILPGAAGCVGALARIKMPNKV
jgi:hypothetical protein